MWCARSVALGVALCAGLAGPAAAARPLACPASVEEGGVRHRLDNASLYDGPPARMADLAPEPGARYDRWPLAGVDPYLVCRYAGTAKTVVLRPRAARVCAAGDQPFRAFCR
jgi:hypothetical protein